MLKGLPGLEARGLAELSNSVRFRTIRQYARPQPLRMKPTNGDSGMTFGVHPLIALGVLASTAATDAAYVFFNAAVSGRRRVWAANWSAIWYCYRRSR